MTKPTIAVVPGAWIPEHFYSPYIHTLEQAGFETRYAEYPSLEPQDPLTADCTTDAKAVRSVLEPLVETEGKDVVLVMHSYGSMPGCAAAKGLSKTERLRAGKLGGILGMILFSAFLVPEGLSCAGIQGGMLPPWIMLDNVCRLPVYKNFRFIPMLMHNISSPHLVSTSQRIPSTCLPPTSTKDSPRKLNKS